MLLLPPVAGGSITEGIVGIPRFVNPVLAVTRADQDMSALLYSGLMKINEEGVLVPDMAESVTVSDDGRTYNVLVRRDTRFHDDTPLTARDVAFTIGLIQNPDLKSPLRGNWAGVTVEEISEYELNIVLDEPYTPFIENFTVGIIPRHIWSSLPIEQVPFSQRNTRTNRVRPICYQKGRPQRSRTH
jgi:peptide/nickel transport system substrate-binding protein